MEQGKIDCPIALKYNTLVMWQRRIHSKPAITLPQVMSSIVL